MYLDLFCHGGPHGNKNSSCLSLWVRVSLKDDILAVYTSRKMHRAEDRVSQVGRKISRRGGQLNLLLWAYYPVTILGDSPSFKINFQSCVL